jgi:hypothetical protein
MFEAGIVATFLVSVEAAGYFNLFKRFLREGALGKV